MRYVARVGEKKPEGKRRLGRARFRMQDNIEMNVK
jgi:hypothetical protein